MAYSCWLKRFWSSVGMWSTTFLTGCGFRCVCSSQYTRFNLGLTWVRDAGEDMSSKQHGKWASGSGLIVGNGIAGTQADLDLINPGFYFYLLEKSPAICGKLAQLNKTSPTKDSAMWIISPDLVKVDWIHHHTNLPTSAELKNVTGRKRYFQPGIPRRPSYADLSEGVNVL